MVVGYGKIRRLCWKDHLYYVEREEKKKKNSILKINVECWYTPVSSLFIELCHFVVFEKLIAAVIFNFDFQGCFRLSVNRKMKKFVIILTNVITKSNMILFRRVVTKYFNIESFSTLIIVIVFIFKTYYS